MRVLAPPPVQLAAHSSAGSWSDAVKCRVYSALLDRLPEAVAVLDSNGRYLEVNEAHLALMGGASDSVPAASSPQFPAISPAEFLGEGIFTDMMREVAGSGTYRRHVSWRGAAGAVRQLDCSASAVRDAEGRFLQCVMVATDVTDREEAAALLAAMTQEPQTSVPFPVSAVEQQAARTSEPAASEEQTREGLLAAILETTTDIAFAKDLHGRFLYINAAGCRVLRRPFGEIVGARDADLWPGERASRCQARDRHVLQTQAVFEYEEQFLVDGMVRTYTIVKSPYRDALGRVVCVVGLAHDITERKAVQEALRASQERLALAVEGSSDALWDVQGIDQLHAVNPDIRLWWSPSIYTVMGLDPSEPFTSVGDWLRHVHEEDRDRVVQAAVAHLEQRTPYDVEYRIRTSRGDFRWIHGRGQAIWDDEGRPIRMSGSCQDVTARRANEDALRESEERYKSLADLSPVGMFVICDGVTVYVNQATCRIMGATSPEQILSRPPLSFVHPDCLDAVRGSLHALMTAGEAVRSTERKYVRFDGTVINVKVEAAPITWGGKPALQAMFLDVTERTRTEEALRLSEERFAKAFRSSPHPLMITEAVTGVVVDSNRAACESFGYEVGELVGRTTLELGLWADLSAWQQLLKTFKREGTVRNYPVQFRTRRGELRDFLVSAEMIDLSGSKCLVTVGNDITERRRAEKALLQVAEGVSAVTGEAFFFSLVRHLSEALAADFVVITRPIVPGGSRVRTVAVFGEGRIMDNFEYDLPGTPCGIVFETNGPCLVQRGVQAAFPDFGLFKALNVESYLGVPMLGRNGEMLGMVGLMKRGALEQHPQAQSLLKIFVSRAAAEVERQDAEAALRESEARYRTLVENIRDVVYLVSPGGLLLSLNPAFEQRLGWSRDQWIGKPFLDLVHPGDRTRAASELESALAGHWDMAIELRLATAYGGWMSVECAGGPYQEHQAVVGVLGVARDVTARKLAEAALVESRANLRRITDAIPGVVCQYRLALSGCQQFLFVSRGTMELLGRDAADVEADADVGWRTVLPEDAPGLQQAIRVSAAGLTPLTHEFRVRLDDGRVKWVHAEALPERHDDGATVWNGIFTDVTARRDADQQLRFTQFAMDQAADAFFVAGPDGRMVYANHEACRSLGYAPEELFALTMDEIALRPEPERSAERLRLAKQGERVHFESVHRTKDGRAFPVEVSLRYLEHGGQGYTCSTVRDVTERQQLEQQLRHADRLATLGTITAGVAHELNNPLFVISGQLHLIERKVARGQLKAIGKEVLAAQEAAQRASEIVEQFLYTAHASAGELQSCDVVAIARKAIGLLHRDCQSHRVAVETQFATGLPTLKADPQALLQVILNLVTNARHALEAKPTGRRIRVAVDWAAPRESTKGAMIECRVEDNGPGIAPEHLARIFDPFFTTKAVGQGTGLGLAICHRIISELQGTIRCVSQPGQGAIFIVCLPVRPH